MNNLCKAAAMAAALFLSASLNNTALAQGTVTGTSTSNQVVKFSNTSSSAPTVGSSIMYDDGSHIGIGTTSPSSYLHLKVPHVSGKEFGYEMNVDDASGDFFRIMNGTLSDGTFEPYIWGHCQTWDQRVGLALIATAPAANDDNTSIPLMTFGSRRWDGTNFSDITSRPLFTWYDNNTVEMQMDASGNLGISTASPAARLHIIGAGSTSATFGLKVESSGSSPLFSVRNDGYIGVGTSSPSAQIDQELNSSGTLTGILSNTTTSSNSVTGIAATSNDNGTGAGNNSTGVSGTANLNASASLSTAYGIYGATGCGGNNNTYYAIYGNGNAGCGGVGNTYWAGYFNGAAGCTGSIWTPSDVQFKDNIQNLGGALENLMKLQPKSYVFKTAAFPGIGFPQGTQMGFIAQDVEQIFPGLVKQNHQPAITDGKGNITSAAADFKMLNYDGFIPVIVAAMQEQQATIAAQQTQNTQLLNTITEMQARYTALAAEMEQIKAMQAQCCGSTGSITVPDMPRLDQNMPNPFTQNTIIKYYLPAGTAAAVITVRAMNGAALQSFQVSGQGEGQVTINAGVLAPGTYQYDLTINGRTAQTRMMVIAGN